jgi:hypothetical protein
MGMREMAVVAYQAAAVDPRTITQPDASRCMVFMSIRRKYLNWTEGFVFPYIPGEIDSDVEAHYSKPSAKGTEDLTPQWTHTGGREFKLTVFLNDYGEYASATQDRYGNWSSRRRRSTEENITILEKFCVPDAEGAAEAKRYAGINNTYEERPPILEFFTGYLSVTCVCKKIGVKRKMFSNGLDGRKPGTCVRAEVEIELMEILDPAKPPDAEQKRRWTLVDSYNLGVTTGRSMTGAK